VKLEVLVTIYNLIPSKITTSNVDSRSHMPNVFSCMSNPYSNYFERFLPSSLGKSSTDRALPSKQRFSVIVELSGPLSILTFRISVAVVNMWLRISAISAHLDFDRI
jgi:hypothetical protein